MSPLHLAFLLIVAILGNAFAQDDTTEVESSAGRACSFSILDTGVQVEAQLQANDQDNRRVDLSIRWLHHVDAPDSFWISTTPHASEPTLFVTDGGTRSIRNSGSGMYRALALHHLRERLSGTALRLDDLELLARPAFMCQSSEDSSTGNHRTTRSNMWYSATVQGAAQDSILFNGFRKAGRSVSILKWSELPLSSRDFPAQVRITEGSLQVELLVHTSRQASRPSEDSIDGIPTALWNKWQLKRQP